MIRRSNYLNLLDRIETATSKYSLAHIEQALAYMGVTCTVMRKKKERTTDEVYGVHGGSELSSLPSTSIYDRPLGGITLNEDNLADIDIEDMNAGNFVESVFDHEEFDESFYDQYEARVLLNSFQWRSISRNQSSYLEDSDYAYMSTQVDIESGDIIVVKGKETEMKFKCYYPQLIGTRSFMIYRFRLTNVQE